MNSLWKVSAGSTDYRARDALDMPKVEIRHFLMAFCVFYG